MKLHATESSQEKTLQEHSVRVLMVEDDPGYRTFVRRLLLHQKKPDFDFTFAGSVAQCRQYFSSEIADVILLDLSLPDSAGLATIAKVMEIAAGTPIVVLTERDDEYCNSGLAAVSLGAQDYLVKHRISNEALVRGIRYAIERRKFEESAIRTAEMRDFTCALAHDLKVPLIGSGNVLTALMANQFEPLLPKQAEAIALLLNSNDAQLCLVQRLLDLYKFEVDSANLVFEFLDLRSLISDSVENLHANHQKNITVNLPTDIPQLPGDRQSLRRLFDSLLDNAIRYGDERGVELKAEIKSERLTIQIHNFGPAISAEMQVGLFHRFFQGVPGKRYVARTGMGLYLCHRIASIHRGRLSCHSSSEAGTNMTLTLPI